MYVRMCSVRVSVLHAGIRDSHKAHLLDSFDLEFLREISLTMIHGDFGVVTYRHDLLLVAPLLVRIVAALRAEEQLVRIWTDRAGQDRTAMEMVMRAHGTAEGRAT